MAAKLNLLTILTFMILGLFFARAVEPTTDTYWHLAIGKQVFETKSIPNQDPFVYGPENNHFTSTEWLAALIFYSTVKYFGFDGLTALRVILALTTIFLLYLTIKLITQNITVQLLACIIVGYTLAIRLFDRPENFSFLFLAIVNYTCLYYYFKRKISFIFYFLPFIFLAWPNIHPLVIVGMTILAIFTAILFLEEKMSQKKLANFKLFLAIAFLSFLASFIQYQKFFYFLFTSQVTGFGITEFMSLSQRLWQTEGFDFLNSISLYTYLYFALLAIYSISFTLFIKSHHQTNLKILSLFYLLILLSPIKLYRLIQMAVLISIPAIILLTKATLKEKISKLPPLTLPILLTLTVATLVGSILIGDIVGSRERVSLVNFSASPDSPSKTVGTVYRFWKPLFPVQSQEIITNHLNTKRLFTSNFWSSYFIWHNPKLQVFADVMHEYRTKEDFVQEKTLETGDIGWQELINKHQIDTVVNSQFFVFYPNSTPVYTLPNWKLVYLDDVAIIYARDDVVKSTPVDLSAIHPELPRSLKFKPEEEELAVKQLEALLIYDSQNGFAAQQLVQYYLDRDLIRAKDLAEKSRLLLPKDPLFSLHLAYINAYQNNCKKAKAFGHEAIAKSHNHPIIKNEVDKIFSSCQSKL